MNKFDYLEKLNEILIEKGVNRVEAGQVLNDYEDLYDQALEEGLTDEEIVVKLGSPKIVYQSLKADLKHGNQSELGGKITGVMVFVSIAIFFVLGMAFQLYEYSWLSFLLIPITGVITSVKGKDIVPALSVFISVIAFYLVGMIWNLWHPGWLVFLVIPISGILVNLKDFKTLIRLLPFVVTIIYFTVSYYNNSFYETGWPIFFLVPIIGSLFIEKLWLRWSMFGSLLLATLGFYLILNFTNTYYGLLFFIVPIILAFVGEIIKVSIDNKDKQAQNILIAVLTIVTIFILVSVVTKGWSWTWLILLTIPMSAIYLANGFKNITAYSPFVAVILFYVVGVVIPNGFSYSWLFFLIIPISGILFEGKKIIEFEKNEDEKIEGEE